MAVRDITPVAVQSLTGVRMFLWDGLLNGDTGEPLSLPDYADLTVTFEGTFGVGGSITLQGSNDETNYYALTDPQGNAITKTAAGIELVTETPLRIQPIVTAGDGTTNLQCRILARRGSR